MTDFSSTVSAINALAYEGIAILSSLKKLLDEELDALKSRNIDVIQKLNDQKKEVLIQFDQNNQARAEHLVTAGFSVSKEGLESLLAQTSDQTLVTQFRNHWSTLETTLKTTMDANLRNEQVLMRNSQNVNKLLTILRGQKPTNSLYTAKGAKGNYTGQSHLGKA
ncbi:flagella synthesis protein FlgN [Neptunomonas antarctica]|uniref:Flagellar biosynthesis/type III secretory pathway chaperone n=1 Tax=Neptunomonas antarctica TaxID=619304 RepID=A0A1N7JBG1_9GAMM|nr:flagellar protein FlgN [Neptunomonas antarctica]SIS46665.1 Flagellar biosynthesis/type III secretory pathway chaperone [Neptunomonas antarctica]